MKIRKPLILLLLLFSLWTFLARCVIMKNRWSDEKATAIFKSKEKDLTLRDTVFNGHRIHWAESGSDGLPVLIFIHGSPGSWMNYSTHMWNDSLRARFKMVAIDRPGFGYSDFGKAMSLNDQAALLLPVVASYAGAKPIYVMGHSMGGPVALQIAAMSPELIHRLIIVGGAIDYRLEEKETWRTVMSYRPLHWMLPGAFAPSNDELLLLKNDLVPFMEELPKVKSHVQFLHGTDDNWVPIENIATGKEYLRSAASFSADTILGAGHYIPWKNQEEFIKTLMQLDY